MRVFLIVFFLICAIFLGKMIISDYTSKPDNKEKVVRDGGLMKHISVPIGMENDYSKINEKYYNKFANKNIDRNVKQNLHVKSDLNAQNNQKDIKKVENVTKNELNNIINETPIVNNISDKNEAEILKVENKQNIQNVNLVHLDKNIIENKILSRKIIKENLILDIVLFNNSNENIDNLLKIKCDLLMDGKIVMNAQKNGEMQLKPMQKIRIKDLNLGFIGYIDFNDLICKVEK